MKRLAGRVFAKARWWGYTKWRHVLSPLLWRLRERRRVYPVVRGVRGNQPATRKALLDFVVEPFLPGYDGSAAKTHSNWSHVVTMAELLNEMGYEVDVTDWRNRRAPPARNYDVVLGVHQAFTASCRRPAPNCTKIYLGTGAWGEQAVSGEEARLRQLRERRGVGLRRRYRVELDRGPLYADAVFVLGSEWVCQTYRDVVDVPILSYPNTVIDGVRTTLRGKCFSEARSRFLWLSGFAAVHRGLDVVLEVFRDLPRCELWVCGSIEHEHDFMALYRAELTETPNIHFVGWVDVTGDVFAEITSKCAYLLYPSASDGMPGSVVTAMASGLVPLVTREAGIDTGGLGRLIPECTPECVRGLVLDAAGRDPAELAREADRVVAFTRTRYSEDAFRTAFRECLCAVLKV